MLYEAIRLGYEEYHRVETAYDESYAGFFAKWNVQAIDQPMIDSLRNFLAQFKAFSNFRWDQINAEVLQRTISQVLPNLLELEDLTVLDNFMDHRQLIAESFDTIAECQYTPMKRNQKKTTFSSTAASKILHAINPSLFIMWDDAIRGGYGLGSDTKGKGYAYRFLPRMQRLAEFAIRQVVENEGHSREDAISSLVSCGNSLAKVLDEYNYVKFTKNNDAVWQKEYALLNSTEMSKN
ncbi:MAG: hypothetical protein F4X57_08420 [Chloroflexi bacterium]|nr:hypothetical protein [Chloroflexota bacterium]